MTDSADTLHTDGYLYRKAYLRDTTIRKTVQRWADVTCPAEIPLHHKNVVVGWMNGNAKSCIDVMTGEADLATVLSPVIEKREPSRKSKTRREFGSDGDDERTLGHELPEKRVAAVLAEKPNEKALALKEEKLTCIGQISIAEPCKIDLISLLHLKELQVTGIPMEVLKLRCVMLQDGNKGKVIPLGWFTQCSHELAGEFGKWVVQFRSDLQGSVRDVLTFLLCFCQQVKEALYGELMFEDDAGSRYIYKRRFVIHLAEVLAGSSTEESQDSLDESRTLKIDWEELHLCRTSEDQSATHTGNKRKRTHTSEVSSKDLHVNGRHESEETETKRRRMDNELAARQRTLPTLIPRPPMPAVSVPSAIPKQIAGQQERKREKIDDAMKISFVLDGKDVTQQVHAGVASHPPPKQHLKRKREEEETPITRTKTNRAEPKAEILQEQLKHLEKKAKLGPGTTDVAKIPDSKVRPMAVAHPQLLQQPQQLHLCLKLYDKTEATDVQWGSPVKAGHEIGILIKNPNPMQIKALCSVNREDGTQLEIKGSKAAEIDPQKAMVLCLFTPQLGDKKIILSYLANQTPVVKGKGVYFTRLIVGIEPDDNNEPTVVHK